MKSNRPEWLSVFFAALLIGGIAILRASRPLGAILIGLAAVALANRFVSAYKQGAKRRQ